MEMMQFKYRNYDIYVGARQSINKDGLSVKWRPYAELVRADDNVDQLLPLDFSSKEFDSEQEAKKYAAVSVKALIDSGNCKI